jgi:predicted CopG family antitoxin
MMSKLIAVSDEVYATLSKYKTSGKSFTDVIKQFITKKEEQSDISRFAGIMKDEAQELERFKRQIQADRRATKPRRFS